MPIPGRMRDSGRITLAYRESSCALQLPGQRLKPTGMTVELSQTVAVNWRRSSEPALRWRLAGRDPRKTACRLLANGTIDLECGSTTNNTVRTKEVGFAINHFYTGTRLLVKKSSASRAMQISWARRRPSPPAPPPAAGAAQGQRTSRAGGMNIAAG